LFVFANVLVIGPTEALPPVAVLVALPPVAEELLVEFAALLEAEVALLVLVGVVGGGVLVVGIGGSHSKVSPLSTTTLPGASPGPVPRVPVGTWTRILFPVQFQPNADEQQANAKIHTVILFIFPSQVIEVESASRH
jgi:hypothetical protein